MIIIIIIIKWTMDGICGLGTSGSGEGPVVGSYKMSYSIKGVEFVDSLTDNNLCLPRDLAQCGWTQV
jgi:hypothetical protein